MAPIHRPKIELSQPVPPEVEAGIDLTLQVRVSCPSGCDLRGNSVQVVSPDGLLMMSELVTYDDEANETEAFSVTVPPQIAEHSWTVSVPGHQTAEVVHEECSLIIPFTTRPHSTSMAVWDVSSPVVISSAFRVKVGVKCSPGCPLTGELVEVRDERGKKIGGGRLGQTPWPETTALYCTEVDLIAPSGEGMNSWSANCSIEGLELPHVSASAGFSFRVAGPPEHRVTVKVIAKDAEAPLENADVRLGFYRASTDESGVATLDLPNGTYDLNVVKPGFETLPQTIAVAQDVTVQVEATVAPDPASDDDQLWM